MSTNRSSRPRALAARDTHGALGAQPPTERVAQAPPAVTAHPALITLAALLGRAAARRAADARLHLAEDAFHPNPRQDTAKAGAGAE